MPTLSICVVQALGEESFSELAKLLARGGHRVTILRDDDAGVTEPGVQVAALPRELPFPTLSNRDSLRSYRVYSWLCARERPFDVVHFAVKHGAGYFTLAAKRQGIAFASTHLMVHTPRSRSGRSYLDLNTLCDLERDFMEERSVALADTTVTEDWDDLRILDWHSSAEKTPNTPTSAAPARAQSLAPPLVSVCITHFDRPHYLSQALGSALTQSYSNCEVIVVDDASTAPTAKAYLDTLEKADAPSEVRIVRHETNRYLGAARNTAARSARGDYVLFLDDDDLAKPELVSTLVCVAEHTKADVVTSFVDFFSSAGAPRSGQKPDGRWIVLGAAVSAGVFRNEFGSATALFRKSAFDELGGYSEDHGVGHEDWELYARAVTRGHRLEVVPEPLVWYRKKAESMLSSTSSYLNHVRHLRAYQEEALPNSLRELAEYGLGTYFLETELEEECEKLSRRTPTDLECMLTAGKSLWDLRELRGANQVLVTAFELAEATGNEAATFDCLFTLTKVLVELDQREAADRTSRSALERAREANDVGAIFQALLNRAFFEHRAGEGQAAGAAVREALQVVEEAGNAVACAQCSLGAAELYLEWDETGNARALVGRALRYARMVDDRVVRARAMVLRAELEAHEGDAKASHRSLEEAMHFAASSNDESLLQKTRLSCAELLAARNETSPLRAELLSQAIRDATTTRDGLMAERARALRSALVSGAGNEPGEAQPTVGAPRKSASVRDRPRILLLADRPGWAFDVAAKAVSRHLSNDYEFRIAYVQRRPPLELWPFDAIHVFWWGETYHQQVNVDPSRVIKEIASYRWALEERYGRLTPEEAARTYLADARTLTTVSKRLQETFAPFRDVLFVPNGYDPAVFRDRAERDGPLRIGWAGNAADPCKGLEDVLKPALSDGVELRIADGSLSHRKMADFYNSIDVLCISSTAEGEPLTLLEAMACGCFPVAVDVGMVPELVRHRENGLIVERSVDAFRDALSWCRGHVGSVREAGHENSLLCRETRTWESVVELWGEAFQAALDGPRTMDPCDFVERSSESTIVGAR